VFIFMFDDIDNESQAAKAHPADFVVPPKR